MVRHRDTHGCGDGRGDNGIVSADGGSGGGDRMVGACAGVRCGGEVCGMGSGG